MIEDSNTLKKNVGVGGFAAYATLASTLPSTSAYATRAGVHARVHVHTTAAQLLCYDLREEPGTVPPYPRTACSMKCAMRERLAA